MTNTTTTSYIVTWSIDVDAADPQQAAESAMEILTNPSFPDAVFSVTNDEKMVGDHDEDSVLVEVPYPPTFERQALALVMKLGSYLAELDEWEMDDNFETTEALYALYQRITGQR